jgi:hypothetical protein
MSTQLLYRSCVSCELNQARRAKAKDTQHKAQCSPRFIPAALSSRISKLRAHITDDQVEVEPARDQRPSACPPAPCPPCTCPRQPAPHANPVANQPCTWHLSLHVAHMAPRAPREVCVSLHVSFRNQPHGLGFKVQGFGLK